MAKAVNKLQEISADEKMREAYRAREKARLDMVSKLKYARREGIEEGKRNIAMKLLEDGLDTTLVAKYTDLSLEEIEEIEKEILN